MSPFSQKNGKLLAVAASVLLLASIVWVIGSIFAFGYSWLRPADPLLGWDKVAFSNAIFLFVIGWTDLPEKARKSKALRIQVQCWAIWQTVLGVLVVMTVWRVGYPVLFFMFGAAPLLIGCSAVAAYRAMRASP